MVKKVGIIAAVLCTAMTIFTSCAKHEPGTVLYIGSERVETDEFMLFASRHKAETVRYFADQYDAQYGKDFWTTDFDGLTPRQYLSDEVISELKEIKMLQKLAKKEGIMKSNSYSDLINTMHKANEQRKQQKKSGEIVYGVTEYTPYEYYSDSMAKLRISLKETLAEKLNPDKEELKKYYEEIKDSYYKKSDECNLTVYSFPQDSASDAETLMNGAEPGENIKAAAEALGGAVQDMDTDYESDRYLSLYYPGLMDAVKEGKVNSVQGPYRTGGTVSFVRINEIKDGGYKSFDDVESNVLSMYMDNYIDDKIESMSEKAKVRYTDEYDGIDLSSL